MPTQSSFQFYTYLYFHLLKQMCNFRLIEYSVALTRRFYQVWRLAESIHTRAVNVLIYTGTAGDERITVMKDCGWKTRQEVTEWQDGESAQLALAQQIHFEGPQISQCYVVRQNPQRAFAMEEQKVLTLLEAEQSELQCKLNTPTGCET